MESKRRAFFSFVMQWLPLLLWAATIFLFSHQPKSAIADYGVWDTLVKKGAHLLAYAVLALLARRAGLGAVAALLFAVLFAISDEFHQSFITGRHGRLTDVLIDSLGAVLGLLLYQLWQLAQERGLSRWGQRDRVDRQRPRDA